MADWAEEKAREIVDGWLRNCDPEAMPKVRFEQSEALQQLTAATLRQVRTETLEEVAELARRMADNVPTTDQAVALDNLDDRIRALKEKDPT